MNPKFNDRPSGLTVEPPLVDMFVMPPPQRADMGIAGYMNSAAAPLALNSHADICAVPRSVSNPATPNPTAVTGRGVAAAHIEPEAPGARLSAVNVSEAEVAG